MDQNKYECLLFIVNDKNQIVNVDQKIFESRFHSYKCDKNLMGEKDEWKQFWRFFNSKCESRKTPSNFNEACSLDIDSYIFKTSVFKDEEPDRCIPLIFVKLPYYDPTSTTICDVWIRNIWSMILRRLQQLSIVNKDYNYVIFHDYCDGVDDLKTCTDKEFVIFLLNNVMRYMNRFFEFKQNL